MYENVIELAMNITLIISILCFTVGGIYFLLGMRLGRNYPDPKNLLRSNGMIHHPTYGSYPEEVEFHQGMALLPGQMAEMELGPIDPQE